MTAAQAKRLINRYREAVLTSDRELDRLTIQESECHDGDALESLALADAKLMEALTER